MLDLTTTPLNIRLHTGHTLKRLGHAERRQCFAPADLLTIQGECKLTNAFGNDLGIDCPASQIGNQRLDNQTPTGQISPAIDTA